MNGLEEAVYLPDTEATIVAGESFAARLRPGDVVALSGGLGAGKTHFTKGIVRGLSCGAEVTSPTFSLVHEYRGGRLPVFHFDFYRMQSEAEILAMGWDDYLESDGVCVVEWASLFPALLPLHTCWLCLQPTGEGRQLRQCGAPGDR